MRGARVGGQLGGGPVFLLDELFQTDEPATAVRDLVLEAFGAETAADGTLEPVPYLSGSPATGALYRLCGITVDGAPWSLFCKVLQHIRHWPMLAMMPPRFAADMTAWFPWRIELDLWDPIITASLPEGLRAPRLHRVIELPGDRIAVWQEDVIVAPAPFGLDHYARAAFLLGRWNARCTTPEVLATSDLPSNDGIRRYAENAVPLRGLEPLEDDALWGHPWLIDHADLRRELRDLGRHIPELLDRLDTMIVCLPHGDASPQNLLIPADAPDTFVVIDISFRSPHALGFDLGQLLVGLIHSGDVPAAQLPAIADRIVPAYLAGLGAEGIDRPAEEISSAFAISAMLRSGFDSFLYALIEDPTPEARATFDERVALCRFLADQVRTTLVSVP
jgi:hypothetical protein